MRIQHMRELLAIKDQGNFSKAAKSLFITQPALSRHVKDMEKELGVKLLERDKHRVALTDEGAAACDAFRKIVRAYDGLELDFDRRRRGMVGTLRLGMLYYTIREDYAETLERFSERYPNVDLMRLSCQPQDVFRALEEDRIDIGVIARADYPDGGFLRYRDIETSGLEAMMLATHPLARKKKLALADLDGVTTILLRDDPYSNFAYAEALRRCGFVQHDTVYTDHVDTVPFELKRNDAVYIKAAGFSLAGYGREIVSRPLECEGLYVTKSYTYRADNSNPLVGAFLDMTEL